MKTKIAILLLMIVIVPALNGQTRYYSNQKLNSEYLANGWNSVHFCGSMALNMGLQVRGMEPLKASFITMMLGLSWELLDAVYASQRTGQNSLDSWLDPKGADWRDLVMDAGGIIAGNLVCNFRIKKDAVMVTAVIKLN